MKKDPLRHFLKKNFQIPLNSQKFRHVTLPSTNSGLIKSVIGSASPALRKRRSLLLQCLATKVCLVIPYIPIPSLAAFTNSIHCSISKHFTFVSSSSSNIAMHAFLSLYIDLAIACLSHIYPLPPSRWALKKMSILLQVKSKEIRKPALSSSLIIIL